MRRRRSFIGFLSVIILITILISACKKEEAEPVDTRKGTIQAPIVTVTPTGEDAAPPEKPAGEPQESAPDATTTSSDPNEKVSLASADHDNKADHGSEPKAGTGSKPKIQIESPYTDDNPTLLGFSLKTSIEEVVSRIGAPKDKFVMENDNDPITVYNYTDFLMGFNKKNQLHFIDVRSEDIYPGLGGLKLGSQVAEVIERLGKPDVNTSYVLTYKAMGAMLKMDIDPKTQKVNSIKLFEE